jgi:hypothetical protein
MGLKRPRLHISVADLKFKKPFRRFVTEDVKAVKKNVRETLYLKIGYAFFLPKNQIGGMHEQSAATLGKN